MRRFAALACFFALGSPALARADYAPPPWETHREPYRRDPAEPRSTVRVFTGPALRVADGSTGGGLTAAIDVGARAAGLRVTGAWVGAGRDQGISQYAGELWIDFGEGESIRPIVAAGAGVVKLDFTDELDGELDSATLGVGVLRAGLQYRLPVEGVDARVAADLTGSVPAVAGERELPSPWVIGAVTVGVGF